MKFGHVVFETVAQPISDLGDGTTIEHFTFSSVRGYRRPLGIVSIVMQQSRRV